MSYEYKYNGLGQLFRREPGHEPKEYNYGTKEWGFTPESLDVFYGYDVAYGCSEEFALKLIENGGIIEPDKIKLMSTSEKKEKAMALFKQLMGSFFKTGTDEQWRNNYETAIRIISDAKEDTNYMWAVEYLLRSELSAKYSIFYTIATRQFDGGKMNYNQSAELLAKWCENNLNLNDKHYAEPYGSLGPCILDCVYSLRAKYFSVTVPIVDKYGKAFMNGRVHDSGYTLSDFIDHINQSGGPRGFAINVAHNMQVIGKKLKSEICLEVAQKLVKFGVETLEDFQNKDQDLLDYCMRSVYGMGDAAVNYMFMLAGDQNRVKPDVHIHRCIREATGQDVSNDECQTIFKLAVDLLKDNYPKLTIAHLDGLVWSKFRVGQK